MWVGSVNPSLADRSSFKYAADSIFIDMEFLVKNVDEKLT